MSRRRRPPGLTLVEVTLALATVTVAGLAIERLVTRSIAVVAADRRHGDALLLAASRLAEARRAPPDVGGSVETRADGTRVERRVRRTAHPLLREVEIRVRPPGTDAGIMLLEVVRVPPP